MNLDWLEYTQRFWRRVDVRGNDECWPWLGARNSTGYGSFGINRKTYVAHRVAAYICGLVSTLSAPKNKKSGGFILHECDNRLCCNPRHMRLGTFSQNQLDAYSRGRRAQPKGHNHKNSKLSPEQVRIIRKLFAEGVSSPKIGKQFDVDESTILNIIHCRTYRNV